LGVIMHEMVTGRVPFDGETPLSIAIKHKNEKPRDTRELNPLVPEAFAKVILKCLEKDREKRYQSADALFQELSRIQNRLPTAIREISRSEPIGSREITVKFRLWKLAVPAAILVAVLAFLILRPAKDDLGSPARGMRPGPSVGSSPRSGDAPPPPDGKSPRFSPSVSEFLTGVGGAVNRVLNPKDPNDIKALEKIAENFKGLLPEKGPYVDAYNNTVAKLEERKKLGEGQNPAATRESNKEIQGEMQKLLSLVSERQSSQKAKDIMDASRAQAQKARNLDKNLLFRLSRYEETNADDAFAKNDYSGSKALYRILERLYTLCPQCPTDQACVAALRQFVAELKKDVEAKGRAAADPWLYDYAREIESQADAFTAKNDLENAGGAYIRAAFLYEKIKDTAP
jgi:hypothetical protein